MKKSRQKAVYKLIEANRQKQQQANEQFCRWHTSPCDTEKKVRKGFFANRRRGREEESQDVIVQQVLVD